MKRRDKRFFTEGLPEHANKNNSDKNLESIILNYYANKNSAELN